MEESTIFPQGADESPGLAFPESPRSPQEQLTDLAARLLSDLAASGVAVANEIPNDPANMTCVVSCGEIAPPLGAFLDVNSGISGRAVRESRMLHSHDTAIDPRVDKEACERLGIRSLVVAPLFRSSSCVGVLEVFSDQPGAFDVTALTLIQHEAVRAASLMGGIEQPAELTLPNPQNWAEPEAGFKVDQSGRLSSLQETPDAISPKHRVDAGGTSLERTVPLEVPVARRRQWRWIGLAAVAVSLAFSAPRLLHHTKGADHLPATPAFKESGSPASVQIPSSMSDLVSDASPPVRVLMAQALAGNSRAQGSLADHYATGDGVPRDRVKATVWYIIAGTKGSQRANRSAVQTTRELQPFEVGQVRFNVAKMFRDGIGTSQNLVTAYSWFSLAETAGDPRAPAEQRKLEEQMPADQVVDARRRAAEWLRRFKPRTSKDTVARNTTQ
ncbi:MAG TPA: GAF domain-containing protein [Terriglobales bacterium]|nr:GAF domain-containing protein [Terriglobales bacterium]